MKEGSKMKKAALFVVLAVFQSGIFASGNVTATDNITDVNNSCFRITTPTATYYFDKVGAGFTSIVDKQGNDWIGYDDNSSSGSAGYYRGLPNLGDCCHPGYPSIYGEGPTDMTSTKTVDETDHVRITSIGHKSGTWQTAWDFYPSYAQLTVVSAAQAFAAIYEGTPGGSFQTSDYYYTSDGVKHMCSETHDGVDLPDPEWVAFCDNSINRCLLYVNHSSPDNIPDTYWGMENNMTVFGFARTCHGGCNAFPAAAVPKKFTIALLETRVFANIKTAAENVLSGGSPTRVLPAQEMRSLAGARPGGATGAAYDLRGSRLGAGAQASQRPSKTSGVYVEVNARGIGCLIIR